jgi:hypothetical protein
MATLESAQPPAEASVPSRVSTAPVAKLAPRHSALIRVTDVTGVFCTSGSEREFTLEGSWYADEEIQAGADRNAVAAD